MTGGGPGESDLDKVLALCGVRDIIFGWDMGSELLRQIQGKPALLISVILGHSRGSECGFI